VRAQRLLAYMPASARFIPERDRNRDTDTHHSGRRPTKPADPRRSDDGTYSCVNLFAVDSDNRRPSSSIANNTASVFQPMMLICMLWLEPPPPPSAGWVIGASPVASENCRRVHTQRHRFRASVKAASVYGAGGAVWRRSVFRTEQLKKKMRGTECCGRLVDGRRAAVRVGVFSRPCRGFQWSHASPHV
jgi:hypothetical protein